MKQQRHRVPAVGFKRSRGGVIAGDHKKVRRQVQQAGNLLVDRFDQLNATVEIPVFTGAVGLFYMQEKEIDIL